jgi:hypothetical protein
MSGQWPPGWEDPEEEFPEGADQMGTEAEARLSEVAAYLASVNVPVMPDAVETRINEALAAEAAGPHAHGPAPARARVRRQRFRGHSGGGRRVSRHGGGGGRPRRDFLLRHPVVTVGSLVVCLLLAGLGFTLARGSTPGAQSSAAAAPAAGASAAGSSAARASAARASAEANPLEGPLVPFRPAPRASSFGSQYAGSESSFLVTASGTEYQRATLATQARARSASSTSAGAAVGTAPSAALRGCVLHLTGGTLPRLVDRATYQGEAAYVVISSTRVWVVGLGCTAAKTELIVSVALAGLPGNLRALVSVEQ